MAIIGPGMTDLDYTSGKNRRSWFIRPITVHSTSGTTRSAARSRERTSSDHCDRQCQKTIWELTPNSPPRWKPV